MAAAPPPRSLPSCRKLLGSLGRAAALNRAPWNDAGRARGGSNARARGGGRPRRTRTAGEAGAQRKGKREARSGYTKAQMREMHLRQCAACRETKPQTQLLRVVRLRDEDDPEGGFHAAVDANHAARWRADASKAVPPKLEGRAACVNAARARTV